MRFLAAILAFFATQAPAEQHLAEIYAGILACEDRDCIGAGASLCMEITPQGDTTTGMVQCLSSEADVWDDLLNEAYGQAMAFAKSLDADDLDFFPEYAVRADRLRDAQRAWIAYRDAKCTAEYALWGSGTMRSIAGAGCYLHTAAERTLELRGYVLSY